MTKGRVNTITAYFSRMSLWVESGAIGIPVISSLMVYFILLPRHIINELLGIPLYDSELARLLCALFLLWGVSRRLPLFDSVMSGWPLIPLIIICVAVSWSTRSNVSLIFLVETAFGIFVATEYNPQQQFKVYAIILGSIMVMSLAIILFIPEVGITSGNSIEDIKHFGTWRGVLWHKNTLASVAGLSSVFFLYRLLQAETFSILWAILSSLSVLLLWQAQSVTALLATVITLSCMAVLLRQRLPVFLRYLLLSLGIAIPVLITFLIFYPTITGTVPVWMIKDPSMSSRILIWHEAISYGLDHSHALFGYGLTFWNEEGGREISQRLGFNPFVASNGFVDAFLSVGFVGLGILLFALLRDFIRVGKKAIQGSGNDFEKWVMLFLVYLLVENSGDSFLLLPHEIFWIFWVSLSFSKQLNLNSIPAGTRL